MKIYISSCTQTKSGTTNGRKWTMYKVESTEGKVYTAFSDYSGLVGQEVEREVQNKPWTGKDGKQRDGWTILEPKLGAGVWAQQIKDLSLAIADLQSRVSKLEVGEGANLVAGMRKLREEEPQEEPPF